jgi:hypothetical protein
VEACGYDLGSQDRHNRQRCDLVCLFGVFFVKDDYMTTLDETRPLWFELDTPNLLPWLVVGTISLLIGTTALLFATRSGRKRGKAHVAATAES